MSILPPRTTRYTLYCIVLCAFSILFLASNDPSDYYNYYWLTAVPTTTTTQQNHHLQRQDGTSIIIQQPTLQTNENKIVINTTHYFSTPLNHHSNITVSPVIITIPPSPRPFRSYFPPNGITATGKEEEYIKFFEDNVVFPPMFNVPWEGVGNVTFYSPALLGRPEYNSSQGIKGYPASLKLLSDASVFRIQETTYVANSKVWVFVQRCCNYKREPRFPRENEIKTIKFIDSAVVSTSEIWADQFYHGIAEQVIPTAIAHTLLRENPTMMIIVAAITKPILAWFNLLHIDERRILVSTRETLFVVKKLYYPFYNSCGFNSHAMLREFRKWAMIEHPELFPRTSNIIQDQSNGHILLINRQERGQCNRCIHNSQDLFTTLKFSYPHRKVIHAILGDFSSNEQVKLFSHAALIVAPHGAGFTNLVFAQEYANVIEIFNQDANFLYSTWAVALHLNYYAMSTNHNPNVDLNKVLLVCLGMLKE
jgi:hypothetical protein